MSSVLGPNFSNTLELHDEWEGVDDSLEKTVEADLKESDESTMLRGGTGEHGIQLSTVRPIRKSEKFWEGGVKVSFGL